jgi:cytidylate kinase
MAVITISRESGSRGRSIGRQLAEQLGYFYVDRELIHEVSLEYGVRQDEFERIYEHAPGLLERYNRRNQEIVQLIGRIIHGLAARDNVVLVCRDAFAALRNFGDVLNLRVTARRKVRIEQLQQDNGLTRSQAKAMLDRLDTERSKYVGAFFGLDWADSGLYDLCLNTTRLTPEQALELALHGVRMLEANRSPESLLVRNEQVDPILNRAIDEALSLLEATGQV